jgi:hypothetical protein
VFLLTLAVAGCQQFPWALDYGQPSASSETRERERAMNTVWKNRSFSELVAALGKPLLIMSIPGGGNPPGFVAVYGDDPATGCIDAFALVYGSDPMIRAYYCR